MRKLGPLNPYRRIHQLIMRPVSLKGVRRWVWAALLLSALAHPIVAQIPDSRAQKSEPAQKSETTAQPVTDPHISTPASGELSAKPSVSMAISSPSTT